VKNFVLASRPKTLIAAVSPIWIGTLMAFAQGIFNPWILLFTLLTGLGIQISTNMANDLFDHLKGADNSARKGPTRVTASGLMTVMQVKKMTFAVMGFTAICSTVLIYQGGIVIAALVALALLLALGYTAGPFPLAYLGIAELFVFIFFGPVGTGCTYYLQTNTLDPAPFIAGIAPGLISCAILVINNLRDVEEDLVAGRKNLICRFGTRLGKWEFALFVISATTVPLFFYQKPYMILLCVPCFILAVFLALAVAKNQDPYALTPLFGKTGKLLLAYTIFFSIGYLL